MNGLHWRSIIIDEVPILLAWECFELLLPDQGGWLTVDIGTRLWIRVSFGKAPATYCSPTVRLRFLIRTRTLVRSNLWTRSEVSVSSAHCSPRNLLCGSISTALR